MSIRITTMNHPHNDPHFVVHDLAVAELWKHGWEPPAGKEYHVRYWDQDQRTMTELHIPARLAQATATPTAEQIESIILQRLAARLDLVGITSAHTGCAVVQAAGDAAEAIRDLLGGM